MTTKNNFVIISILISLIFTSCKFGLDEMFYRKNSVRIRSTELTELSETNPEDSQNRFKNLIDKINDAENAAEDFNILVFADIHFGASVERDKTLFFTYLDKVKGTPEFPKFAVCLGDIAETGISEQYAGYKKLTDKLFEDYGLVTLAIPGNHDLFNNGISEFFDKVYPHKTYYRIKTDKTSFYFLDSGNGTLGRAQLKDFREQLKNDANKKIVFSHYPLCGTGDMFETPNTRERAILLTEFNNNNVKSFYSGHNHHGGFISFGNFYTRGVKGFNDYNQFTIVTVKEKATFDESIDESYFE